MTDNFEQFLAKVRAHFHDIEWLNENEAYIFENLIEDGLEPHRIHQIATVLERLLPYYLKRPRHYEWEQLVEHFLQITMQGNVQDALGQAHVMAGQFLIGNSDVREAIWNFWQASMFAKQAKDDQARVAAYVELLKAGPFCQGFRADAKQAYHELKAFADQSTDATTQTIIWYALAVFHLKRGEFELTNQMAGATYEKTSEQYQDLLDLDIPDTDYEMHHVKTRLIDALAVWAMSKRAQGNIQAARQHIAEATSLCDENLHHYQLGILASEQGWLVFKDDILSNGDAIRYIQAARQHFRAIGHQPFMATADHSLGIMLTEVGEFEDALKLLEHANRTYTQMESHVHSADVIHAIGYLYYLRNQAGDKARAKRFLKRARTLTEAAFEDMPARLELHLGLIDEDLQSVEENM